MADRLSVAVLGATGVVGQRFIQLLTDHPWFELAVLTASPERRGQRYSDATTWVLEAPMPEEVRDYRLEELKPEILRREGVEIVFSALPKDTAVEAEPLLAREGFPVFSNASPYRMEPDVPLVNGEVNPDHLSLIEVQKRKRGWKGVIVKNPNCTTAILTLALKPLMDAYGLQRVLVTTMQAVTGAGLRGVPSTMIIDNLIPFIEGEEEKVVNETRKILGKLTGETIKYASIEIAATTTRVPVIDGHTEVAYVVLNQKPGDTKEVIEALERFQGLPQKLRLPTAPRKPIIVKQEQDRPQPRLDRMEGKGMSVVVGRLEMVLEDTLRMVVLGHNTIRGAAGAAILAAEIYLKQEELK